MLAFIKIISYSCFIHLPFWRYSLNSSKISSRGCNRERAIIKDVYQLEKVPVNYLITSALLLPQVYLGSGFHLNSKKTEYGILYIAPYGLCFILLGQEFHSSLFIWKTLWVGES